MPTAIDLCNDALALFNQDPITSLNDDSRAAKKCKQLIDSVRRKELVTHPWYFARTMLKLAPLLSDGSQGWAHTYMIPTDCLYIVQEDLNNDFYSEFTIRGDKILSNKKPLELVYIYDVTDYNKMPVWFYDQLKYALAIELIPSITSNYELQQGYIALHTGKVRANRAKDSAQGPVYKYTMDSGPGTNFINVRYM